MRNFVKFLGIIILTVVIGFSMAACDDGGGGGSSGGGGDGGGDNEGVSLPQSSGTNEVIGKTLYIGSDGKIVFANSGTSFEEYGGGVGYIDDSGKSVFISPILTRKGSYSYNSENKTITLAVEYWWDFETETWEKINKTQVGIDDDLIAEIRSNFDDVVLWRVAMELPIWADYWDDYNDAGRPYDGDTFLKQWLTQKGYNTSTLISQWKRENPSMNTPDKYIDTMVAEQIDEMFSTTTYDYQFTTDNSLLVQEKLPANKGSNELQGKSFTYDDGVSYTFATNGTYTATGGYYWHLPKNGTYAYNSNKKEVWLKPEKIDGKTMPEYYSSSWDNPDNKAMDTNSIFRIRSSTYRLNPNWLMGKLDDYEN